METERARERESEREEERKNDRNISKAEHMDHSFRINMLEDSAAHISFVVVIL